jgi:hypothetical protein
MDILSRQTLNKVINDTFIKQNEILSNLFYVIFALYISSSFLPQCL